MTDIATEEALTALHELGESDWRVAIANLIARRASLYHGSQRKNSEIRCRLLDLASSVDEIFGEAE